MSNMEEMMKMWADQPDTAATMFPAGITYQIKEGDTLKNLGERFNLDWEKIADATMGTHEPKSINTWLSNNGGKKLKSGWWAFSEGQEIKIPAPNAGGVS